MRKAFLLLSLTTAMFCNGQEIDTTTPYYEYEEEVVDTAKAVLIANQMREEKRLQIQNAINELKEQETLLKTLKEKGQKKVDSAEDIKKLRDIAVKYLAGKDTRTKERIMQSLEKGKIHQDFYNEFLRITWRLPVEERELIEEKQKYDDLDYTQLVSPLPKKIIKIRKDNPNYIDENFHWVDKMDFSRLEHKSTTYPAREDYYYSSIHPQYKFIQDKHVSHRWIVYDQSYNLIAVSLPTPYDYSYESFEDGMLDALVKYDYEHDAYNISQDNAAVRKYVEYTANNGRSVDSKLASAELGQAFIDKMMAELRRRRAAGRMTQEEFNKQLQNYNVETAKNKRLIADLRKQLPTKDVIERANNYIRQLRQDNRDHITRELKATRIDGLTILLQSPKGLKVQQTGYYDKKENAVEWKYLVIEKGN